MLGCDTLSWFRDISKHHSSFTFSGNSPRRIANVEGSVITYGLSYRARKVGEPIGEVWLGNWLCCV